MENGLGARDEEKMMKGRLLLLVTILALAVAACAGPDLLGGTDASQESETATEDKSSKDTSAIGKDEPGVGTTVAAESGGSDPNGGTVDEESGTQQPSDETSPTLVTSTTVQKPTPTTSAAAPPPAGTVPPAVADSDFVAKAKADLAERLGVNMDAIGVVSVQEVEWPDRAFGCPEPGKFYAQVISMGRQIILVHDGVNYFYHSGGGGDPFYCANPASPL